MADPAIPEPTTITSALFFMLLLLHLLKISHHRVRRHHVRKDHFQVQQCIQMKQLTAVSYGLSGNHDTVAPYRVDENALEGSHKAISGKAIKTTIARSIHAAKGNTPIWTSEIGLPPPRMGCIT